MRSGAQARDAKEAVALCKMDLGDRASGAAAIHDTVLRFGALVEAFLR